MNKKLQYISQGNTTKEQLGNIHRALDNGCQWIQLRYKNGTQQELFSLAASAKNLCSLYFADYIINDNVYLTQQLDADGVHLGLSDMDVLAARTILGATKIIGGTANTLTDVMQRIQEGCDYIGLGPFQFTDTKQNLSPVLGIEGYLSIIEKTKSTAIAVPIFAIGGITTENVDALMATGIHGIAVSGLITQSENPLQLISKLNEKLYVTINNRR
jgi:thiamine-phosphate pyrophosphorylase